MTPRLVTYRIARTGYPVAPNNPAEVPIWPNATIVWQRLVSDYNATTVTPKDSITTIASDGSGSIYLLPGNYRITLPDGKAYDRTLEAGEESIDLTAILAGGLEPSDPAYENLRTQLQEGLNTALEDYQDTLEEYVQRTEAAAEAAEQYADRDLLATLEELNELEPTVGRRRYVPEAGLPVWANGSEWRTAESYLASLDHVKITGATFSDTSLFVHLNLVL